MRKRKLLTATERRQEILDLLLEKRSVTADELVRLFDVTRQTINSDITVLTCSYPIETRLGPGGGYYIEDGYHLGKQYLSEEQESVLRELAATTLDDKTRATLNSILDKFAHKGVKK